jgi:hypothetical protein
LKALVSERVGAAGTGSTLENIVRRAFEAASLPPPVVQYRICDGAGRFLGRVDFAYPDARADGCEFHSSRGVWERDLVRQNKIVAAGWFVLRTTKQIREAPDAFVRLVWRRLTTREADNLRRTRRAARSGGR